MRIPGESVEVVKGYEIFMHGFSERELEVDRLLLELEAIVYGRRPARQNWRGGFEMILSVSMAIGLNS